MHSVSHASHLPIRRGSADKTLLDVTDLENTVQHSKTAVNVVVQPRKERDNVIDNLEDIAFDK